MKRSVSIMLVIVWALMFVLSVARGIAAEESTPRTEWTCAAENLPWQKMVESHPEEERRRIRRLFEVTDDENTESGKSLQIRLDKKRVREGDFRFFTTERKNLPVGRYRVTVRMKMTGMLCVMGTPIYVEVPGIDRRVSYYGYHFQEADTAKMQAMGVSMGFGHTKRRVEMAYDYPANTIHSINVDYVRLEKVEEPPVRVLRTLAGKRWMKPGQETFFRVWLAGRGEGEQKATLNLYLEHGLDERKQIASREVSLRAGQYAVERFDYATAADAPPWGYRVVAEAVRGGEVISSASDVFTVHPNNYAVKIFGGPKGRRLRNHVEVFGVTAGDCAKVYIEDPERPYKVGMSGYITNNRSQKAAIQWNRSVGVATLMYLFPGYTGNWGADLYLRHPEWFPGRLNFSDEAYRINAETQRIAEQVYEETGGQPDMKEMRTFHLEGHLNFYEQELVERVTRGVIKAMKHIGYDGVRWDGGPLPVTRRNALGQTVVESQDKAMEMAAGNLAYMKRKVREAGMPHFFLGYNGDTYGLTSIAHSLEAEQEDPGDFPQFVEMMEDGGMLMDESMMNCCRFNNPLNRIRDYYRALVQLRTAAREAGGYMEGFPAERRGAVFTVTDAYWYVLSLAAGTHIPAAYPRTPYAKEGLAHFATRFCEFIWDNRLRPLPDAKDAIHVDGAQRLWYSDGAAYREMADRTRIVVPLINPPTRERFLKFRYGELPRPIEEPFEVAVVRPEGRDGEVRAFMLTTEPRNKAVPLEVEADEGNIRLKVPDLKLWRMLVIECR
jgi:hypothetical protein